MALGELLEGQKSYHLLHDGFGLDLYVRPCFCEEWRIIMRKATPTLHLAKQGNHCFFLDLNLARDSRILVSRC